MSGHKTIIVVGGGTGGHTYPAFNIASQLKKLGHKVYFFSDLGNPIQIECKANKIDFVAIDTGKLIRTVAPNFWFQHISNGLKTVKTISQIYLKIKSIRPDVVFSKGGFVSFPVCFVARMLNLSLILHESDSVLGLSNNHFAPYAKKICVGFDKKYYPAKYINKIVYTGVPISQDFSFSPLPKDNSKILIIGGSQGSRSINEKFLKLLKISKKNYNITWITGEKNYLVIKEKLASIEENKSKINLLPFSKKMSKLLADNYLIISRSGATALSEIAAVARPVILAMANSPTYNNNEYELVKSEDNSVYKNSAIADIWEPGSIFKPIIMGIAMTEKLIEPSTEGVFSNMVSVTGYEIHTATDKAFGRETMTQVLENSDNVAMVWVGDKIGTDKMFEYMEKMKIDKKVGIDLDTESQGKLVERKNWRDVTRATTTFGQGFALTPLKMIQLYATLANGGKMVLPHIVDTIINDRGEEQKIETKELDQIFDKETTQKVTDMLVSVVEKGHGKKAGVPGYKIAGKTGTAQIPNPEGRGYLEDGHIGSFAGYFPANNPKYALLVKLDTPQTVKFAESSAAPTFGIIAQWLLNYEGILPDQPK